VRSGEIIPLDQARGLPLGVMESEQYPMTEMQLAPGDLLMLYTDGISEAMSPLPQSRLFGFERLDQVLGRWRGSAAQSIEDVIEAVTEWGRGRPPVDDQTMLAMRVE
jgi:sigma-B regulation protein RsbU (phosphoserine phosphatase)